MTSPAITYATVEGRLEHPVATVWAIVAEFGGIESWVQGVSACSVAGSGVGAVRTVTVRGDHIVRERLEMLDADAHKLRYRILSPHMMPAEDVHGNIALRPLGDKATAIVWHSDATAFHVPPATLGARIAPFYRASIEGLGRLLDAR